MVADIDSTIRLANGTSFAAPIVAGLSACLWQSRPGLDNIDLLNLIQESAHLFSNPNDSMGYGVPNFHDAYLDYSMSLINNSSALCVFPNPFIDHFYISHNFDFDFDIEIMNGLGQLIFQKRILKNQSSVLINELNTFLPGIYFVRKKYSQSLNPIIKLSEK